MLYLAIIFHMHQPYYKDLFTGKTDMPWVRLHATKDYLDMVKILGDFPKISQTINFVPSLFEQIEGYASGNTKDRFLELSYKPAKELNAQDKEFILKHFFSINKEKVTCVHPRYYQLYLMRHGNKELNTQDFLDLQLWFNLAWIDPSFRKEDPELRQIVNKARFFSEDDKALVLNFQQKILREIIPTYKAFSDKGQIELSVTPYFHPILPLLFNTKIAREANLKSLLPKNNFEYPEDAMAQITEAVDFYEQKFGNKPLGMWPSEEAVSEHILPFFMQSGINWIVADEGILFKPLKLKSRNTKLLYQPHLLKRKDGNLNIIFRDRNLSDLIGFVYHAKPAEEAANDFIAHLKNINAENKDKDALVTIAMDGENAWEYYANDGIDFLRALYEKISESDFIKAVTVSEYLKLHPPTHEIKRLAAGSWIYSDFGKWMGNPYKVLAWDWLAEARNVLKNLVTNQANILSSENLKLAYKQIYIAEGSDWFWWYGEELEGAFDRLFRMHLKNFYKIIGQNAPEYLNRPLKP